MALTRMSDGSSRSIPLSARVRAPERVELPAAGENVTWRAATRDDIPLVLALKRAAGAVDHPRSIDTLDELESGFEAPTFDAARDAVIALDPSGRAVAYGAAAVGDTHETIVWVDLDGAVHPDRRREGIGTALLAWQEARGLQHLAASDAALPGWLASGAEEHAAAPIALLRGHGYEAARWWLELDRDLSLPIAERVVDPAVRVVPYSAEWAEPARRAFNDSFRDHWGSQPVSAAEWEAGDRLAAFRPDLSVLAIAPDAVGDDHVVAFVTSSVNTEEWEPQGYSFGYLSAVGVRREWRGRDLARALITQLLHAYRAAGFERAVLAVDADSPTGALGLYESLGFRLVSRSVSLVKRF